MGPGYTRVRSGHDEGKREVLGNRAIEFDGVRGLGWRNNRVAHALCVPRRHSCRRLACVALLYRYRDESRYGTQKCVRHDFRETSEFGRRLVLVNYRGSLLRGGLITVEESGFEERTAGDGCGEGVGGQGEDYDQDSDGVSGVPSGEVRS